MTKAGITNSGLGSELALERAVKSGFGLITDLGCDLCHRDVQVVHEDILDSWKMRVTGELWPSFAKLVESALSSHDPQVHYEE